MIYASWCGHCHRALPIFEEISLSEKTISFSKIEVSEIEKLKNLHLENKIKSIPTFVYIIDDETPVVFQKGFSTSEGLIENIKKIKNL